LGLLLIETLSDQLEADYTYETENGETHFTLTFEKKEVKGSSSALMQ
jgi:two-component sensor histidine kinase